MCHEVNRGTSQEEGYQRLLLSPTSLRVALTASVIGLSAALSLVGIQMPMGGRASLEMVPILYICWLRPDIALQSAIGYGLMKIFLETFIVHPIQLLLDYPIAFGVLSLASLKVFRRSRFSFLTGATLAIILRTSMHVISGAVFFASTIKTGNPWLYSLVYNLIYMIPSGIVSLLILSALIER